MLKISIIFCLEIHFVNLNLAPDCTSIFCVYASSKSSGKSMHMHMYNARSTNISQVLAHFFNFRKVFPKALVPLVQRLGEDVEKYIHAPYARELKGLSTALNMSVGDVVIINILYDITA